MTGEVDNEGETSQSITDDLKYDKDGHRIYSCKGCGGDVSHIAERDRGEWCFMCFLGQESFWAQLDT